MAVQSHTLIRGRTPPILSRLTLLGEGTKVEYHPGENLEHAPGAGGHCEDGFVPTSSDG